MMLEVAKPSPISNFDAALFKEPLHKVLCGIMLLLILTIACKCQYFLVVSLVSIILNGIFCVISRNFGIMVVKIKNSEFQNFLCRQLNCHNSTYKVSPIFLGRVLKCRRISNVITVCILFF